MFTPSDRAVLFAKVAALAVILAFAPLAWVPEFRSPLQLLTSLSHYGRAPAVYGFVVIAAFAGLIVTPFLRNTPVRCGLVAVLMFGYAVDLIVFSISGSHAYTPVVRTLWQGRMMAGTGLRAFQYVILETVAGVAVLAAALAWPYKRGLRAAYSLAPIGALVLVTAHLSAWGMVIEGYPSPFAVPARLVYVLSDTSTIADLPLKPVPAGHVSPSPFTHIVFIVDESIRGDYLTINDPRIDTTPFLEQSADRLINFGIATSGSNCSHESRWLLRRGVRPWQMPEASTPSRRVDEGIVDGPRTTLFQFAKAAGFNVVYVDAWTSLLGAFRDGTTAEELTFVDERLTLESDAQSRRDLAAARALVSVLKRPGPTFVQVDKLGAHLPYDEFTPEDFNRYTRRDGARFLYKRNNREDQVGSYKNAVAWSVDEFFRAVLPNVDLRETLILYTSDHGENLGDGGYMWGHCSIDNVHPSEEWVPLFALTGSAAFGQALSASARTSFSDATHFEIVPTLLRAMGYDPAWVSDVYGPSLLEIPRGRPRRFLVGDVLFSKQRTWSTVAPWTPPPSATSSDRR